MLRRRGKEKPDGTELTVSTVQEDESFHEMAAKLTEDDTKLDEMAAKVERVAASARRASFCQLENSVYAFGNEEPLLTPTATTTSQQRQSSRRTTPRIRQTRSSTVGRRASIFPLQDFRLRYHAGVIVKESTRMLQMLLHGTPRWMAKLIRLTLFVTSMMPAFIVFLYFYVVSSDRIAVSYKSRNNNRTSRHYLDIYGSTERKRNASDNYSQQQQLKPVIFFLTGGAWIIGYKMWGALLARALVPFGIIVVIPDYRNFPQTNIDGIMEDTDLAVDWTLKNIHEYGGDPSRVVIAGQSAGAHIGACLLLRKAQKEAPTLDDNDPKEWHAVHISGFIAVSGPYDLVAMREILHQNGLDKSIVSSMFCNDPAQYSPTLMVRELDNDPSVTRRRVQANFPPTCIIHGEIDKTVPFKQSLEFFEALLRLGVEQPLEFKLYPSWSHTDPILEAPFAGNHLFHKDVYELVKRWTCDDITASNNGSITDEGEKVSAISDDCQLLPFDENHPACQKICPVFLVETGRFFNPF